jgi:MOSC domain-containing protein
MVGTIAEIWRYPVKGLAGERLERVAVTAGRTLPHDRRFAIAHGDSGVTPATPRWELKTSFHMLMHAKDERLAELSPSYDEGNGALTIRRNGTPLVSAHAGEPSGRAQLDAFFADILGGGHHGAPRFVEGDGFYFGNIEAPVISLINLASVRDLAGPAGGAVDRRRFRANVYIDGPAPWAERALVGRTLRLGGVRCRVVDETIRCGATTVNPATCARDLNVPKILERAYGHMFCGVYLAALDSGEVGVGAPVGIE